MTSPLAWPEERIERFRRLWRKGLTDDQLAEELSVSRRAVISQRRRWHLSCNRVKPLYAGIHDKRTP
jgi:hypothetical protein